jgi:hypothetical protein
MFRAAREIVLKIRILNLHFSELRGDSFTDFAFAIIIVASRTIPHSRGSHDLRHFLYSDLEDSGNNFSETFLPTFCHHETQKAKSTLFDIPIYYSLNISHLIKTIHWEYDPIKPLS